MPQLRPGQCTLYIASKQRYCSAPALPGKQFCGNHDEFMDDADRQQILCPLDPTQCVTV